ncbi:MAG: tRNA (guanosine(46)-N7)-methyltransferase TrmB [Alphaproteobacteria bacterium]|nr:tRNA (guanosine(46)-N7)-methyltransferase TrmB [Alphaproteobacteria bacterium]
MSEVLKIAKRLFGRRKGRPLRTGQSALMETLLPKVRIELPEEGGLDPFGLFATVPEAVRLEIGFGGGEHLAAQAAANPSVGFMGCEPFVNGVAKLLTQIEAQKLMNVRILPDDARLLLDTLPDGCLETCFVLFADPWPKKRHAERRFIGKENLDRLARVMQKDGQLRLATDVVGLAQWMREQVTAHPAFACLYDGPQAPADWVPTRYEQKGKAAGREPDYLIYKKI